MMKNKVIYILIIIVLLSVLMDILIRVIYCQGTNLIFHSQEFNNIASPIISFLGFVGLIIAVLIALNQFRHQQNSNYFEYYKELINKFLIKNNDQKLDTIELLNFAFYTIDKYDELKINPDYMSDLKKFKNGNDISSSGKNYDNTLSEIRYFKTKLAILLKRYELLLDEILSHKNLSESHKDLLLIEFFENQILKYTVGLQYADTDLNEVKDNLFIGFANYNKDKLHFYDNDLYKLKNKVETDVRFRKYLSHGLQ